MVQMKGIVPYDAATVFFVFISHMVQMKVNCNDGVYPIRNLYIPHGSDESSRVIKENEQTFWSLYPTWFR